MQTEAGNINLFAGWIGMLAGALSGAVIGLFFHRDDWMGGYDSYRRRLTRLGHISFFGLGFINILYGLTVIVLHLSPERLLLASWFLLLGAASMPAVCFLSAWRKPWRHLFFIPVGSVFLGVLFLVLQLPRP
jgi:hypothetical protein